MQLLNWGLIKHPMNWATIFMMLFIAGMAGALALQGFGVTPSTK